VPATVPDRSVLSSGQCFFAAWISRLAILLLEAFVGREEITPTNIPHAKFGAPRCGGFLYGRKVRETAGIICDECFQIVQMVSPAGDLRRTLNEMMSKAQSSSPRAGSRMVVGGR
jgi:hypothetical protein